MFVSENQALKICCFGELCMLTDTEVSRNGWGLELLSGAW